MSSEVQKTNKTLICPACGLPWRNHGNEVFVPEFQKTSKAFRGGTDRDVSLPNHLNYLSSSPPYRSSGITSQMPYTGI